MIAGLRQSVKCVNAWAYFEMHSRDRWLQRLFVTIEAAVFNGAGSTVSF
jgi:hypothetical protein